ncbi:MAG: hypothetical protein JWQ71_4696 [Pedosphaera sp.]|nr:hypothetical protein [Pedosphaera sp.]
MSLSANSTRLSSITKEILAQWQITRDYWKDAKAEEFERKYMDELRTSVDMATDVIEQLDKLVTKIKKDCE